MTAENKEKVTPTAPEGKEEHLQGPFTFPRLPLPGMPPMPTGTAGRVVWWGGLAALAAFDVVEWPVAVIVGAGSWVAEQFAKSAAEGQHGDQQGAPQGAQHTPSQQAPSST